MSDPTPVDSAFSLLHPGLRKQLWRMGWASLRPLQEKSVRRILSSPGHAILSAATAAGKTEAAFLPVLSVIADESGPGVRAVYVGPLKALINDQFGRLEELCGYLDVPVHRWHGDVSAGGKSRLLEAPAGVLLITPESIESLFINRPEHLKSLFGQLRFVVIDELHSFLDTDRGVHLRSLLFRLRRLSPGVRFVGLSATVGDFAAARRYIDWGHPELVEVIADAGDPREMKFAIRAYASEPVEKDETDPGDARLAADLVKHCAGGSNLVFANAKADVELFADLCARLAAEQRLPDRFLVHHGSLSADLRQETEEAMKSGRPATAFCSSTLEMGVDIGAVRAVGQIGPPSSVGSLKQRLGRSGRRAGEPRILRIYLRCQKADEGAETDVLHRLQLPLVQAVAASELMLRGWVEPPSPPLCDLSTLAQQVMSVVAETGSARADALFERLCSGGAFEQISSTLFAALLRQLADVDCLEQVPGTGDLILGLKGEALRKDRGFYAVFKAERDYTVVHAGHALGTLALAPTAGESLLFAGRRWRVKEVDEARRELRVEPSAGSRKPLFVGDAGEVHDEVRRTMRDVLAGQQSFPYLDALAADFLAAARTAAKDQDLCEVSLLPLAPRRTAWLTWAGTRTQQTLQAIFANFDVVAHDAKIALVFDLDEEGVRAASDAAGAADPDPHAVARSVRPRFKRKYDELLGDGLLDESISRDRLALDVALGLLRGMK